MKQEIQLKVKRLSELDAKHDERLKDKEREMTVLQADLRAQQDLCKDSLHSIRLKSQQILILQQQLNDLETKVRAKTESDMTMREVIDRVKGELSQHYTPIIKQYKDELNGKDLFY